MKALFKNGYIYIYESRMFRRSDVLVEDGIIKGVFEPGEVLEYDKEIDLCGKYLMPGLIHRARGSRCRYGKSAGSWR